MTSKLVTSAQKVSRARDFVDTFSSNTYYIFMSNYAQDNSASLSDINDNLNDTMVDPYRNMVQGKVITSSDVNLMIRNIPYVANTIYDMYDDQDILLSEKNFYVVVDEESFYHVYKCLDNNLGSPSTAQPTFSHISGSNNTLYQTSDGYRWKYMYSVDSSAYDKFSSDQLIPVTPNTSVIAEALPGSIDIIKIESTGRRYDNYVSGTFKSSDLRINSNTRLYAISNTTASTVNGFYTGCSLYISSGAGIGENRKIVDYICSGSGNFIVLDTSLTSPLNGSQYEIYPSIEIKDVNQTINVVGRALVNSLGSNSIYRIELFDRGQGYSEQYVSANVVANVAVPVTQQASLRVIYSPPLGHGYDAARELYSNTVAISVTVSNTESNTLLGTNQFRQFGILYQPTFNNVVFNTDLSNSTFIIGETFYNFTKIKIADSASINTTSVVITSNDALFDEQVDVGEMIYIQSDDTTLQQLVNVASITNSSSINCASNGLFEASSCKVYKIDIKGSGQVSGVIDTTNFTADNCSPVFNPNTVIVGYGSGKTATINTITRNDVTKDFSTFIQLYKYTGVIGSGVFQQNEIISQGESAASLFATVSDGSNTILYASNQSGIFESSDGIIGQTSDAVYNLSESYSPELAYGRGDIIYIENIDPVTRSNTENEKFQIYFEF